MVWLRRIGFFLLLNFTVITMISLIVNVFHLDRYLGGTGYAPLLVMCFLWGMVGSFISLLLSKPMAKWTLGVQVIDPNTHDPQERMLLETVARLSQAAGIQKMPQVGVYPSPEVNAFATGATKNSSLVAVSSGILQRMDRPALEGVLGHEITHVANGDMVTMALLQGVVNAFVMALARIIAIAIDNALRPRDERGGGLGYFGQYIAVMILQTLLFIPGSMVIAAFSRFREFRADEGGARLAGKDKMILALRNLQRVSELNAQAPAQPAYASFKISRSGPPSFADWFASHPPLETRIAHLDKTIIR